MTSSLFESFSSQNFPSNPTVPPSAPPGFSAPSSVANPASTSPPMTSAQITALQNALQDNNLQQVVQAVTGAYVPSTGSSFDQLEVWAQSLDNGALNIENLVSSMLGIPTSAWDGVNEMLSQVESWATQLDGGIQQLQTWWNSLVNGLLGSSGGGTGSVFDLTSWLQNAEANASAAWTQLEAFVSTGNWSDLTAALNDYWQAIFGSATSAGLTGSIAAPTVTNTATEAQLVPNFPNAASVTGGGGWAWDGTTSYNGSGGSVEFTGGMGALRGVVAPVQPDQTVALAAVLQWSGLTYTGSNPIQLQLIPWNGTTPGNPVMVAQIASPASSGSWTPLSGSYTVPSSGVTAVQIRLFAQNLTGGSVWWAACTTTISGGFLANLQTDLNTLQSDAEASTAAFGTLMTSWEAAITGYTSWSTFITALETAWTTYSTTESGLLSSEIFTLQNLFNTLLGISPSTGQMSATNVSSSLSLSSLEADFDTFLGWFGSPSGSATTTTLWTDVINDIINPINAIVTQADTWWSQLLTELGVSGGSSGTSVGSTISTTQTQAGTQNSWWGRLMTDVSIYIDLFHVTYPVGSPSDGPTTTISGVRTWYSAVADILSLFGVVHSVSAPSNPASDVGTTASVAAAAATTAGTNASIAIASASAANTLAQGTIDGLNTAWSAGGTGNPVTTVPTIAAAIPTSAIVGGTGAAVAFGAVGAGGTSTSGISQTRSISESHTAVTGDLGVVVAVTYAYGASGGTTFTTTTATYGGSAMTKIGSQTSSGAYSNIVGVVELWWFKSPTVGTPKTVAITVTGVGGSAQLLILDAQSQSMSGSKVGTVNGYTGSGSTSLSMTASSSTGKLLVGAFAAISTSGTVTQALSAFSQTQEHNESGGYNVFACCSGYAAGASSVNFAATAAYTGAWAGVIAEIGN